jgi:inorganic pyrophosphatase
VPKTKQSPPNLASPLTLTTFDPDDADLLVVVIETPKGSRSKYPFDALVLMDEGTHSYTHVRHIDDLGKAFETELDDFFVSYQRLSGRKYRVLGMKGPRHARRQVKTCRKAAARRHSH